MDDNVNLLFFFGGEGQRKGFPPTRCVVTFANPREFLLQPALSWWLYIAYTYILWHKNVPQSSKSYKSCKLKIYTYLILFQYPGCPIHVSPGCAWITTIEPLGHDFILCFAGSAPKNNHPSYPSAQVAQAVHGWMIFFPDAKGVHIAKAIGCWFCITNLSKHFNFFKA